MSVLLDQLKAQMDVYWGPFVDYLVSITPSFMPFALTWGWVAMMITYWSFGLAVSVVAFFVVAPYPWQTHCCVCMCRCFMST
jgi:hypothetical protein